MPGTSIEARKIYRDAVKQSSNGAKLNTPESIAYELDLGHVPPYEITWLPSGESLAPGKLINNRYTTGSKGVVQAEDWVAPSAQTDGVYRLGIFEETPPGSDPIQHGQKQPASPFAQWAQDDLITLTYERTFTSPSVLTSSFLNAMAFVFSHGYFNKDHIPGTTTVHKPLNKFRIADAGAYYVGVTLVESYSTINDPVRITAVGDILVNANTTLTSVEGGHNLGGPGAETIYASAAISEEVVNGQLVEIEIEITFNAPS